MKYFLILLALAANLPFKKAEAQKAAKTSPSTETEATTSKPNVVVIISDQWSTR